jgi:hypothetical protein
MEVYVRRINPESGVDVQNETEENMHGNKAKSIIEPRLMFKAR